MCFSSNFATVNFDVIKSIMFKIARPISVKVKTKYKIWVKYDDGIQGEVDLSHLAHKGIFKLWDSTVPFENVYIDSQSYAISWSKDIDIAPDNVYFKLKQLNPEEVFSIV